jgi:hypothetical protein
VTISRSVEGIFYAARGGCLIKLSRRCHRFVMHES